METDGSGTNGACTSQVARINQELPKHEDSKAEICEGEQTVASS